MTAAPVNPAPPLVDRRDLVDGINPAFLRARAILPIGLDGDRLLCAVADPDDLDAQAAMAFASGRAVVAHAAPRDAILATIDGPPALPLPRIVPEVRHAGAVLELRRYLIDAHLAGANAVRIVADRRGGTLTWMADGTEHAVPLTARDALDLIDATDALSMAGNADRSPGFALVIADDRLRAVVEKTADGRSIRLEPA